MARTSHRSGAKARPAKKPSAGAHGHARSSAGSWARATAPSSDDNPSNVDAKIQQRTADYHPEANLLDAVLTFAIARRAGTDPPRWSLALLVGLADLIRKLFDEVASGAPVKGAVAHVCTALGLDADGTGIRTLIKQTAKRERNRAIYLEVNNATKMGTKLDFAYTEIAMARNVSRSTIVRAYLQIKKLNRNSGKTKRRSGKDYFRKRHDS
jgi:hypothetical protein